MPSSVAHLCERVCVPDSCSCGRIISRDDDEAVQIFSKYQAPGCFARRLKKPEALTMLQTEFNMDESEAEIMFTAFDKDQNDILSLWEFRQFYLTIGKDAHGYIQLFKKLEKDGSGTIDIEKAFEELKNVQSSKDKKLTDDEIEMYLKTTAGEEKSIDLHKFLNMMCRIKVHRS